MARVLILAGAPATEALDWSEDGLLDAFDGAVARFAGLAGKEEAADDPQWRVLPEGPVQNKKQFFEPVQKNLATLQTETQTQTQATTESSLDPLSYRTPQALPGQVSGLGQTSGLPPGLPSGQLPRQTQHDSFGLSQQFWEHSLAAHNELPSSAVVGLDTRGMNTTTTTTTSFDSFASSSMNVSLPAPPSCGPLTALADLPSAAHLLHIAPATATANLVAAVVGTQPPRTVRTRWGATSTLTEVILGDETKTKMGFFGVTFWGTLAFGLQEQDVVLVRNVALGVFDGKVYGSSLRKGQTTVELLWRSEDRNERSEERKKEEKSERSEERKKEEKKKEGERSEDKKKAWYTTRELLAASESSQMTEGNNSFAARTARVWTWALRCVVGEREAPETQSMTMDE